MSCVKARYGMAGMVRRGWSGGVRYGKLWQARYGEVRFGMVRIGLVGQGEVCYGRLGKPKIERSYFLWSMNGKI